MSDYFFNQQIIIRHEIMHQWLTSFFAACGMSVEDAATCADVLVSADLRGVYSHGCIRIPMYCNRLLAKGANPVGRPKVVRQKGATALVDGDNAMGQVVATFAMRHAIELAREFGSSTVSITGSNHLGTSAHYALTAAENDMIGMLWVNGGANNTAPWGGKDARVGNNPFAFAMPCFQKPPVVLDMAQSVVAGGKILMAMATNSPIPDSWALDSDGNPTTDAVAGNDGTLRPMGDYKGYGIAFINMALAAILSDSAFGSDVQHLATSSGVVQNTGQLIKVIDIAAITDVEAFKKRMDRAIDYMKASPKRDGVEEIFVPGEPEARTKERQLRDGIQYPVELIEDLRQYAKKVGISSPV